MTDTASRDQTDAATEIEVRELSKVFGRGTGAVTALDKVSLTIRRGEFFTLLGPSGCGKTTLLRMIAGFEHPSAGSLKLSGKEVAGLGPNRRPVNTVFQNYALFPHMTVADNIGFGLKMQGKPKSEVQDTVAEMLKLVKMEAMASRRPSEISGGQQQRVALARALAPRPKVLLLDEPLSALDLKLRKEMQSELKRLQSETGITFVFVTHDQEEALTMSDRVAVMSAGRVLQMGSPEEIYNHPTERFVADFIGDTNFLEADVVSAGAGTVALRLADGEVRQASLPDGMTPQEGEKVTVVIRPENVRLVAVEAGDLSAKVDNCVFFGTDTHVHVRLSTGEPFTLRRQNSAGSASIPVAGDSVGLKLTEGGIQVLRS